MHGNRKRPPELGLSESQSASREKTPSYLGTSASESATSGEGGSNGSKDLENIALRLTEALLDWQQNKDLAVLKENLARLTLQVGSLCADDNSGGGE